MKVRVFIIPVKKKLVFSKNDVRVQIFRYFRDVPQHYYEVLKNIEKKNGDIVWVRHTSPWFCLIVGNQCDKETLAVARFQAYEPEVTYIPANVFDKETEKKIQDLFPNVVVVDNDNFFKYFL